MASKEEGSFYVKKFRDFSEEKDVITLDTIFVNTTPPTIENKVKKTKPSSGILYTNQRKSKRLAEKKESIESEINNRRNRD